MMLDAYFPNLLGNWDALLFVGFSNYTRAAINVGYFSCRKTADSSITPFAGMRDGNSWLISDGRPVGNVSKPHLTHRFVKTKIIAPKIINSFSFNARL